MTAPNPPLGLELVARLTVTLAPLLDVGPVPGGHRRIIPITGGTVDGPVLLGEVIGGGADWNLERTDGTGLISAQYAMRTHDGVVLGITNEGRPDSASEQPVILTAARIEAPFGDYQWLNSTPLVGSLTATPGRDGEAVSIEFWRVVVGLATA